MVMTITSQPRYAGIDELSSLANTKKTGFYIALFSLSSYLPQRAKDGATHGADNESRSGASIWQTARDRGSRRAEGNARQILVKVAASGVCHTDLHAADGDWPVKPKLPFIPGHEAVGHVAAFGAGVKRAKPPYKAGREIERDASAAQVSPAVPSDEPGKPVKSPRAPYHPGRQADEK